MGWALAIPALLASSWARADEPVSVHEPRLMRETPDPARRGWGEIHGDLLAHMHADVELPPAIQIDSGDAGGEP